LGEGKGENRKRGKHLKPMGKEKVSAVEGGGKSSMPTINTEK